VYLKTEYQQQLHKNKIKIKEKEKKQKQRKENTKTILHLVTNRLMFVINSEFGILYIY
jgi:hypothetical protein